MPINIIDGTTFLEIVDTAGGSPTRRVRKSEIALVDYSEPIAAKTVGGNAITADVGGFVYLSFAEDKTFKMRLQDIVLIDGSGGPWTAASAAAAISALL